MHGYHSRFFKLIGLIYPYQGHTHTQTQRYTRYHPINQCNHKSKERVMHKGHQSQFLHDFNKKRNKGKDSLQSTRYQKSTKKILRKTGSDHSHC